jgi:SAM-dependent methyltransferase
MAWKSDQKKSRDNDCQQRQNIGSEWTRRLSRLGDATGASWQEELARVLNLIGEFSHAGRILDLGCGDGQWTMLLAQQASVVALDYVDQFIKESRQRYQELTDNSRDSLKFVQGDLFQLPFLSESFDHCFCAFMLGLVPVDILNRFLAELSRVVKVGGRILFVDALWQQQQQQQVADDRKNFLRIHYSPETLRSAIWPFAEDVEVFRTGSFFVIANYVVRAERPNLANLNNEER